MRAIPYLLVAVGLALLSGSVYLMVGVYFELLHPTITTKHEQETSLANGFWLMGSIACFFGSVFLLGSVQWLSEGTSKKESLEPISTGDVESKQDTLVARPDESVGVLLQPMLVIAVLYQIPFVVLFVLFREQISRNWLGSFGSVALLLILSFFLLRQYRYRMVVGDFRLELDDVAGSPTDVLSGRVVVNRQSDIVGKPLFLELKLFENRDTPPTGNYENSELPYPRELYWLIRFETESPVDNPFVSETEFPFQLSIPEWLPRPWSRQGVHSTIAMEWQLEVSGKFSRTKIATIFPIMEVPSQLKQAADKRIKIPRQELEKLLTEQSILWQRASNTHINTSTIVRKRISMRNALSVSTVCLVVILGCGVFLTLRSEDIVVLILLGSFAMLCAALAQRFIYCETSIDEVHVERKWRIFGFVFRRLLSRDGLSSVNVAPRTRRETNQDWPHVEFNITLQTKDSSESPMPIARVRTRLLAKAFAKAIANDLGLSVTYNVQNL